MKAIKKIEINKKKSFFDISEHEFEEFCRNYNLKNYRKNQITEWIYKKFVTNVEEMTNIPKTLRNNLSENFCFRLPETVKLLKSDDGSTKFLLKLIDSSCMEMVIISSGDKNTLCLSSQVGCKFNCLFCATAKLGFTRDLTAGEIISQVLLALSYLNKQDEKLTNIVFMGMGEPLDNFDNLMVAVKKMQLDKYFSFSPRRITVSTCGYIPGLQKLSNSGVNLKLAVSLNSAFSNVRDKLMPVNKTYNLKDLKSALFEYQKNSKFRITIEYVMLKNINMNEKDIVALAKFIKGLKTKLNLIPYNPIIDKRGEFIAPTEDEIHSFIKKLLPLKAAITLRRSKGQDITAACGQLAGKNE